MAEETEQQPAIQSTMSAAPKQLAATDVLSKIQTGTPLMQGEKLPEVPKGTSVKGFYSQFPGGLSAYSQAPFGQPTYNTYFRTSPEPTVPQQDTSPQQETTPETTVTPQVEVPQDDGGYEADPDPFLTNPTSVDTQMNNLNLDTNLDFEWNLDNNIDNLKNNFAEAVVWLEDATELDLDSFESTLQSIGEKGSKALQGTYEDAVDYISEAKSDLERFIDDGPGERIAQHFTEKLDELGQALSDLTSVETYANGIEYFAESFTKTMLGQLISGVAKAFGAGAIAGPIGILGAELLMGSATQIGREGMVFGLDENGNPKDPWEGSYNNSGKGSRVAGFNSLGIAVDKNGFPVYVYDPISHTWTNEIHKGIPSKEWRDRVNQLKKGESPHLSPEESKADLAQTFIEKEPLDPYSEGYDEDISGLPDAQLEDDPLEQPDDPVQNPYSHYQDELELTDDGGMDHYDPQSALDVSQVTDEEEEVVDDPLETMDPLSHAFSDEALGGDSQGGGPGDDSAGPGGDESTGPGSGFGY